MLTLILKPIYSITDRNFSHSPTGSPPPPINPFQSPPEFFLELASLLGQLTYVTTLAPSSRSKQQSPTPVSASFTQPNRTSNLRHLDDPQESPLRLKASRAERRLEGRLTNGGRFSAAALKYGPRELFTAAISPRRELPPYRAILPPRPPFDRAAINRRATSRRECAPAQRC